jgi:hypothetical protein
MFRARFTEHLNQHTRIRYSHTTPRWIIWKDNFKTLIYYTSGFGCIKLLTIRFVVKW